MTFPVPANESERLQAIDELRILDTPPDPLITGICEDASRTFDVPTVFVSLLDRERQWFKARVGLDITETEREAAFCNHTILQDGPLVIHDARADERFATNRFVVGSPYIRFYAGAPLFFGERIGIGALCLVDTKPRTFDAGDVKQLGRYANRVLACLWSHDIGVNPERYEGHGAF